MIEHADAALDGWLRTLDPAVDVTFDRPGDDDAREKAKRPLLALALTNVREQTDNRDNQINDVRAGDGRVVGRQSATRFFELDYVCSASGRTVDAHRALGDLLQLLVDHDVIPVEHVPAELASLDYPIDVRLVSPPIASAAIAIRVVLPVKPTPDVQIGPPTTSLHLDVSPPPGARVVAPAPPSMPSVPAGERKWTTVRRRELIGRQEQSG